MWVEITYPLPNFNCCTIDEINYPFPNFNSATIEVWEMDN